MNSKLLFKSEIFSKHLNLQVQNFYINMKQHYVLSNFKFK